MVITIIGILIALLLPAVQSARESARRSQCTNNLKQLNLALHLHHEQHGHLPYGHCYPEPPVPNHHGTGSSWFPHLLPYIEQQALYDLIDWKDHFGLMSAEREPNIEVCRQVLSVFLCPSDVKVKPLKNDRGHDDYARGNYLANNGLGPMRDSDYTNLPVIREVPGTGTTSPYAAGVFYLNSQTTFAEIRDGSSNTAFLSEIRLTKGHDFRGVMFHGEGSLYHHNRTPNSLVPDDIRESLCVDNPDAPCTGAFTSWKPRAMIVTARSYHPGGVNLALGDGSVRFVQESIQLDVWKALCTPRMVEGEVVVGDF